MVFQLTPEQEQVMEETRRVGSVAEFEALRLAARPEMEKVFQKIEVQTYRQPIDDTLVTLRQAYLRVVENRPALAVVNYQDTDRIFLRDAIRMLATLQYWFAEGIREGTWRPRPVRAVVEASRPWRKKLRYMGKAAFTYDPEIGKQFADVNRSGGIDEEKKDLAALLSLIEQHQEALEAVGLTPAFITEGKVLLKEAEGHDLLKALGLTGQEDAFALRNRVLTYAVVLGCKAVNFGALALLEDPEKLPHFQMLSFTNALRRITNPKPKEEEKPKEEKEESPQAPSPEEGQK